MLLVNAEQTSWGVIQVPQIPEPYQYPDTVQFTQGGVLSYHHNTLMPLFDGQIKEQGLQNASSYFNPMKNNTVCISWPALIVTSV